MDDKLKRLSNLLLSNTRDKLNKLNNEFSDESVFSRLKVKLGSWRNFLETEAADEISKFIALVNSAECDHIPYHEKTAATNEFKKKLKDMISTYNRQILSGVMNSITQRMLNSKIMAISLY